MRGNFGRALASVIPLALFSIGSATAADLAVKAPPVAVAAPAASWTGCYVDGGAGYGLWNQDHYVANPGFTPPPR